ncbi:MAG: DUF2807 domain-containing protein [Spirochaetales bacterium]|nr:DUF2807 domain-containing protein [Spirochaetales bacterium]
MKKILVLFVLILVLISSCIFLQPETQQIDGSGDIVSINAPLTGEFVNIAQNTIGDIVLTESDVNYVTLTGDDNVVDKIDVEIRGNTLYLETDPDISFSHYTLIIYIPVQQLVTVSNNGVGDISADHTLMYSSLTLSISGVGDIDLSVETGSLTCRLEGSGDIELSGTSTDFIIDLNGVGDIDAYSLLCADCNADIGGVGDVRVSVTDSLDVIITGVGSLFYWGDGSVNVSSVVTGVGNVYPM